MADSNDKKNTDKAADSHKAQDIHSFWNSWIGKISALLGLFWVLPTDRIFNDGISPGLENLDARASNAWGHARGAVVATNQWLKKQLRNFLVLTVTILCVTGSLTYIGLDQGNRGIILGAGLVITFYLIFLWVVVKSAVKILAGAISASSNITASSGAAILRKVGLAEGDGESFKIRFENLDEILGKGFIILPALAEGFFILAILPSFASLLLLGIVGLGAIASGLIAAHIADTMVDGWKLVRKINFILFVILASALVLKFFLPQAFGKFGNAGGLDAWLMNPTWTLGWLGTCIVVGIIGALIWIIAGKVEGETGKRLTAAIPFLTIVAMVIAVYSLSSATDEVESAYSKATDTFSSAPSTTKNTVSKTSIPNSGSANGMKMPDMDYKSGGYTAPKSHTKPAQKSHTPKIIIPKVKITKKSDGLDTLRQNNAEIEALLGI